MLLAGHEHSQRLMIPVDAAAGQGL